MDHGLERFAKLEKLNCCQEKANLLGGFFQSFPVLLLVMDLFFPLQKTQIILIHQGFFFLFFLLGHIPFMDNHYKYNLTNIQEWNYEPTNFIGNFNIVFNGGSFSTEEKMKKKKEKQSRNTEKTNCLFSYFPLLLIHEGSKGVIIFINIY